MKVSKVSVSRSAGLAGNRASSLDEAFHLLDWRAATIKLNFGWQCYWQLIFRYRHSATSSVVDDWDWSTPVTLTRYTPVTQAVVNRYFTFAFRFQVRGDRFKGNLKLKIVISARVNQCAFFCVASSLQINIIIEWADNLFDVRPYLVANSQSR